MTKTSTLEGGWNGPRGHCSIQSACLKGACSGLMRSAIIVETLPVAACISRSPGAVKKTALRRSLRNPIRCLDQAAAMEAALFRFLSLRKSRLRASKR